VILGVVVSSAFGKWLIPLVTFSVGMLLPLRLSPPYNGMISIGASAALELLPTVGMGLLFPLLIHLTHKSAREAGRAVGNVYGLNILGSIAGAAGTSLFLVPGLGLSRTVAVALALYTASLVLLAPTPRRLSSGLALFLCCALAGGAAFVSLKQEDPRVTNLGMYIYGFPGIENLFEPDVLFFREGPAANVLVTEHDDVRSLRVNGKVDASSSSDMGTQLASAYFPLFLAPSAREVLVVGFGSGTTPGAALLFPETRVTCAEIEPGVFEASEHFGAVNHRPEADPRFALVLDDGRSFLQGTEKRFDLIISEPSNPWMAGVSNLFTEEFYDLVSQRLTPDGMLAQWIQVYSFSPSDYALVVRTVMRVFSEVRLVRISDGDTILLASMSPLETTHRRLDDVQALVDSLPEVVADLERYFGTSDVRYLLFTHVVMGTDGLRRMVDEDGSDRVNTDVNMRLEFEAPLSLFGGEDRRGDVASYIRSTVRPAWFSTFARELGLTAEHAGAFHRVASSFDMETERDLVREIVELGLVLDPERPDLLADRLITSPDIDAASFDRTLDQILASSPGEASRLAQVLFRSEEHERAAAVLEKLALRQPASATVWTNLAITQKKLGNRARAEDAFQKALSLDPFNDHTRSAHELFRREGEQEPGERVGPSG
jgi:spermidine synthase